MKRVLILQFRKNPDYVEAEKRAFERSFSDVPVEYIFQNVALDEISFANPASILEGFGGVILGGSGELDFDGGRAGDDEVVLESRELATAMAPFFAHLDAVSFPTLGICYGHQILGHSCGVPIVHDKGQAKAGTHEVVLTAEGRDDVLFESIPDSFAAQYGHKDALSCLPPTATLLACGEQCFYSAVRYGKNRYSIQFHPELNAEDLRERFIRHPEFLPSGMTPDMMVRDSQYATVILRNFVTRVCSF